MWSFGRAACVVSGVWAAAACGGLTRASASGAGGAGAGITCPAEALGPPQVVASGRSNLFAIGTSSAGPVWLEARAYHARVVLGTRPPRVLYDDPLYDEENAFLARGEWFVFEAWDSGGSSDDLVFGSIDEALEKCALAVPPDALAMDSSHVYAVWSSGGAGAARTVGRSRLGVANVCSTLTTPIYNLPAGANVSGMAVDESGLYLLVLGDKAANSTKYSIWRLPRAGGPPTTVYSGIDSEPPITYSTNAVTAGGMLFAHQGALAWTLVLGKTCFCPYPAHALPAGATAPRMLGVPSMDMPLAFDGSHLYWTTGSDIQRECTSGRPPEVLARNQGDVVDIAVDDGGVYWLEHGSGPASGKVMEMKRVGAANGVDAGAP